MKKVTNSNTKAEILKAYDELLAQLKGEKSENTALQKKLAEQKTLLEKASKQAEAGATLNLKQIRTAINQQLDELESQLDQEEKKYLELQEAVGVQKEMLENLYKIKTESESLDALIITNKQAKEALKLELENTKKSLLEEIDETKLKWKREQEAYEYTTMIVRRNEEDEYKQKKATQEKDMIEQKIAFEREMEERERVVSEQEDEFKRLKKEAEQFESRLQQSIETTEKSITDRLTKEFEYKQKLEVKDLEAELKLKQQAIQSLAEKVKEQQTTIEALTSRTDNASLQVKDIALKAIENAGLRSLNLSSGDRYKEED